MVKDSVLKEAADRLWSDQSEENWESFAIALKTSSATRYKTIYEPGKLKSMQDLKKSFAQIYDSKLKLITKVPIYKLVDGKMYGATIYLKELKIKNKA